MSTSRQDRHGLLSIVTSNSTWRRSQTGKTRRKTSETSSWARAYFEAAKSELEDAAYVNDLGDDEANPAARAYGGNSARLVELKTKYDPTNLFRMNQNIKPAGH